MATKTVSRLRKVNKAEGWRIDDASGTTKVYLDGTEVVLTANQGLTATVAELNYNDLTTLGTGAASKSVVLDASGNYSFPATGTLTAPSGYAITAASGSTVNLAGTVQIGGTTMSSSAAEIDRSCKLSTRIVSLTGTAAITVALHCDKVLYVTGTAAATYTLPAATGSGARFNFNMGQVNTNGFKIISSETTTHRIYGVMNILDVDAAAQQAYSSLATSDTIDLNGTTKGGAIGDWIQLVDVATNVWFAQGQLTCPAGSNPASPWTNT